jgi:putative ABC transport system substrate-binding protein
MTRDGTVGRSDATETNLAFHRDIDPVRMMRTRFADPIRASSLFGLHQQAGHMTASDLFAARHMISCQAGAIHRGARRRGGVAANGARAGIPDTGCRVFERSFPRRSESLTAAYKEGLRDKAYVPGQNVAIEYRWAKGRYDQLPALASDLVGRRVDVIAAFGGSPPILAAKAATSSIPIVFTTGLDPVSAGLVASLNRPGGNATGVYMFSGGLEAKRLSLLQELVPSSAIIAILINPSAGLNVERQVKDLEAAAREMSQQIQIVNTQNPNDLQPAFQALRQSGAKALLVVADPFLNGERDRIIALAAHYAIPTIYDLREFAVAGGLMSYGTSLTDAYRQVGMYSGRILRGEHPGDLPVLQSTKFDFLINLKTAKALGLTVSPSLLARADEVIE